MIPLAVEQRSAMWPPAVDHGLLPGRLPGVASSEALLGFNLLGLFHRCLTSPLPPQDGSLQHICKFAAQLRVEMTQVIGSGELLWPLRSEIWLCVCKEVKAAPQQEQRKEMPCS